VGAWRVAGGWARQALRHLPVALPSLAVILLGSAVLAGSWFLASRLAYVGFVAVVLRATRKQDAPRLGATREVRWVRFRQRVSWLQDNAAAAFVALTFVTRGALGVPWPAWAVLATGALLCVVGLGTKAWATVSLPPGAYHWRNFFFPAERSRVSRTGPYRWLADPMYSVGYAHLYGWALLVGSAVGLVAAAGAQALMLLLAVFVERRGTDGPVRAVRSGPDPRLAIAVGGAVGAPPRLPADAIPAVGRRR
jgi:protein-S-isoprenylcysteine O-methyltransferase Ste14